MNEILKIPIAEHLEDTDDLSAGRDTELIPGQEALAEEMASEIYEHAMATNLSGLLFCVSPRKRAMETAMLVRRCLDNKPVKLKVVFEVDHNLREIDQGQLILPIDYKAGDEFQGLVLARQIFSSEVRNPDDPAKDNLSYHFGDPLLCEDGSYKYPELQEYFTEPGESFKEILIRYFSQVVKFSENLDRFSGRTQPVVFTHGQVRQFFVILEQLAERMIKEGYTFNVGALPKLCRDLYKPRVQGTEPYGRIDFVNVEEACRPEIIEILKQEIAHLELIN